MATLMLVRHGQTEWNALNLFSGQTDVPLNAKGIEQAKAAAKLIEEFEIHKGHTSELNRAQETLRHILEQLGKIDVPVQQSAALNERSYGVYDGQSKQKAKEELGPDELKRIRLSWDRPIPGGEALRDVHARVSPYYLDQILTDLRTGHNVIVAAHNHSLRALIKEIEQMSDTEVESLELQNGQVFVYDTEDDGSVISKEIRSPRD